MTRKPPDHPQPAPSKPPNVAAMQARLRKETIALLGLRASKLDAGDEIMIARCGALRLMVADLEPAALHGDKIVVSSYVEASTEHERIVRDAHRVAVNADGAPEALASARRKMAELMGVILNETPSQEEQRRRDELDGLHNRIADLEAQLAERAASPSTAPPEKTLPAKASFPEPPRADNVVQLAVGPVVTNDAGSFIDALNRKSW
jgi:hypothetical protein